MNVKFCFKNTSGISLAKDDEVYFLDGKEYFMYIKRNIIDDVSGIYSAWTGELILREGEYDDIILVNKDFTPICGKHTKNDTEYYAVTKNGKVGVYSLDGECILPIEYKDILFHYKGYIATLAEDDTCALYTDTGEMILPSEYRKMEMGYVGSSKNLIRVFGDNTILVVRGKKILFEALCKDVQDYGWFYTVNLSNKRFAVYTDHEIGEYHGTHRHMSQGYILVTDGNKKSVVCARDGTVPIRPGEYEAIRKRANMLIVTKKDGSTMEVEIADIKFE